jgi:hypothetical protein
VFVDEHGVPVAVSDQVLHPERAIRSRCWRRLLQLTQLRPGEYFPRHPEDHPLSPATAQQPPSPPAAPPPDGTPPRRPGRHRHLPPDPLAVLAAATLGAALPDNPTGSQPHPTGQPGAYGIRPRLRRFLRLRAPRCEWPGCGARAARCDLDHDTAWPDGRPAPATSGRCAAGTTAPSRTAGPRPATRRQHRLDQPHRPHLDQPQPAPRTPGPDPAAPAHHPRPGPALPRRPPREQLHADPTDPRWTGLHADPAWLHATPDHDPQDDSDHLGRRIRNRDTAWDLDLHDPYAWTHDIPAPDLDIRS